jgi:hypothetical protein
MCSLDLSKKRSINPRFGKMIIGLPSSVFLEKDLKISLAPDPWAFLPLFHQVQKTQTTKGIELHSEIWGKPDVILLLCSLSQSLSGRILRAGVPLKYGQRTALVYAVGQLCREGKEKTSRHDQFHILLNVAVYFQK